MRHYIKVEMLRMLRNKRYIIFVVAFPVGFYLLYSNLWGAETDQSTGLRGSVLLMVSMAAYGALASAIMSTAVPWSQERHSGWLPEAAFREVADALDTTPAFCLSIATFYDMFHTEPVGRRLVEVCTNVSCALTGAQDVVGAFERELGIRTTPGSSDEDTDQ